MNNLHIENSYLYWGIYDMKKMIVDTCVKTYDTPCVEEKLNRPFWTLYIEWWLHNIGYYMTKPYPKMESITIRFRDVDLNEWKKNWFKGIS
jgi:hypothetical protein